MSSSSQWFFNEAWNLFGFTFENAQNWKKMNITPEVAACWEDEEFTPETAAKWILCKSYDFSPVEARNWSEAKNDLGVILGIEDVLLNISLGYPAFDFIV